jgi:molybdenum cofactor cytidylyltransferase
VLRGLEVLTAADGPFLVLSVDQPRPASLLRTVLDAHEAGAALITVPRYRGRGGHPTVFGNTLYDEMLAIEEETLGLRDVVQRHRGEVLHLDLEEPTVTLDINDKTAYAAALARTLRLDVS